MSIELPKETTDALQLSIKRYFLEQWDQEVGDLKAKLLLDFVLKEIGPSLYNQGVADAQARITEMASELDAVCHEPEMHYWEKG